MEQRLTDRVDGEELIDAKLGGVHSKDRPTKYASIVIHGHWPADYAVKI